MRLEDIGLKIGDGIQIQVGDDTEARYPCRLIGLMPGQTLLVSAPQTGKDRTLFLREGQNVTLRFVAQNIASGFTTRVVSTRGQPYPYLHLEIPDEIQTVEVRKAARIKTNLAATVINESHNSPSFTAHIVNLSCAGARLESPKRIALVNDELSVTISCPINNKDSICTFSAVVCAKGEMNEEGEKAYYYGLDISAIDADDDLVLRAFVYQEMLKGINML